ncbi:hypothetical protein BZA05DRAFT_366333 [Tricharina praecox]|uniref:uncharacterized protein n=1 Tax=Tricharina praecox TaxID=43433 RepID=UPI002220C9C1|nr:uncharacterized protein BZA05DRAFT_366333 [Tricharina praecox]KAI5858811.1 hypothetical protein BZA05DRAFT_366333 [Tricharina praecox]
MSTTFAIFSTVGWQVLPNLITNVAITFWFRLFGGHVPPTPGTPRYAQVYRRTFVGVVGLFLLYNIYNAYCKITQTPNFYDVFSLPHNCTVQELKSRKRKLSILYHPDKVGEAGADQFLELQLAYETLIDLTRRPNYHRFGPIVTDSSFLKPTEHSTAFDYFNAGLVHIGMYYGFWLGAQILLGFMVKTDFGRWWKFLTIVAAAVLELLLITGSSPLPTFPLAKSLLVFEQVALMRTMVMTMFNGLIQLAPKLAPMNRRPPDLETKLSAVLQLSAIVEAEALVMQGTEFQPFAEDPAATKEVERKMADWMVQQRIRNDPEMKEALNEARKRRTERAEKPAAA